MNAVAVLLLTHQAPGQVRKMLDWWSRFAPPEHLFVAYGGSRESFRQLTFAQAFYVDDPRLRTQDHARQRQSYSGVFRAVVSALAGGSFPLVAFFEYDHVPVVPDLLQRWQSKLDQSAADVLCYCLRRIDRTISPHYLSHAYDPGFNDFWRRISIRQDNSVVLSFFPSGSLWRTEAFQTVAETEEGYPAYLELYLPTLAHHLGFRLCDMGEQNRFIEAVPTERFSLTVAQAAGAWTMHPLKEMWDTEAKF